MSVNRCKMQIFFEFCVPVSLCMCLHVAIEIECTLYCYTTGHRGKHDFYVRTLENIVVSTNLCHVSCTYVYKQH